MESLLKFYSIGIVVQDKKRDSSEVDIYPVETIPLVDGLLNINESKVANSITSFGEHITSKVDKKYTITARWMPLGGSNRYSAPDVIKNETVLVLKYGDVDEYYWIPIYNEPSIRRKETVLYLYGNTDKYGEVLGKDNSYWVNISTHDKSIKLHTSDNDGELTTYDVEFNTEKGYFRMEDGRGNKIELDSAKDNLNLNLNNDLNINLGNDGNVDIVNNLNIKTGVDINITSGNDVNVTLPNRTNINLDKINVTNSTAELLQTLSDLIQADIDQKVIGNLGMLTVVSPQTKAIFQALKVKIDSFI